MMRRAVRRHGGWLAALWLAAVMFPVVARAAAAPLVRVEVAAQQPVRVGQQIGIDVTILAPNFFMSAPDFPALQVPGAVVTLPEQRALNSTETIGGVAYAGIRKRYAFTAGQDGDFDLPTPTVRFTYAGEDGAPRGGSVTFPSTRVRAGAGGPVRAGAAGTTPRLPVARLVITQAWDHGAADGAVNLQAGDALVRTVTTFAPDTQAMLIHPPHAPAPRGVRVFAADPRLTDRADDPAAAGGTRIDAVTYVFERSGTYRLPAMTVDWIDPATGKPMNSAAPGIEVKVSAAPVSGALAPSGSFGAEGATSWRNVLWSGGLLAVGLVAGLLIWRAWPFLIRLRQRWAAQRLARAGSADALFEAVLEATRAGKAKETYEALLRWTQTAHGATPTQWAESAEDRALLDAVTALQRQLFGTSRADSGWNATPLSEALQRNIGSKALFASKTSDSALPSLNPG
ncbi:BatD family protein [Cupriavidus agavae]|uniref:Oxygen tolerance protein BatD n=1 Tax=Cupriavidus agavae TaxID=1001822 RepID=A0A4Q7RZM2_9BURK|nr:BatD family protein [Cupriavidus agavae]RZT39324.1 oxygen tolerance protein BatD [Cupriavidus agavae]